MKKTEVNEDDLHCAKAHRIKNELHNTNADMEEKIKTIKRHTIECQECIKRHELYNVPWIMFTKIKWKSSQELLDFLEYINIWGNIKNCKARFDQISIDDQNDLKEPTIDIKDVQILVDEWRLNIKWLNIVSNDHINNN